MKSQSALKLITVFLSLGVLMGCSKGAQFQMGGSSHSLASSPSSISVSRDPATASGASPSGAAPTTINDINNPCRPFRLACQQAGFVLSGATAGNRLIGDCMLKIVSGQSAQSPVTGNTVESPSGADPEACSHMIHHGKKTTIGSKSPVVPTYQK